MVNNIPQMVMTLLYKNIHLPSGDESEFEAKRRRSILLKTNQFIARLPRSTWSRINDYPLLFIATTYEGQMLNISAVAENAPKVAGGNIRMGLDHNTREGLSVCGRCHFLRCSHETCRYNNMTCSDYKVRGHVAFECVQPRPINNGGKNG
ncbi:hypothetical protein PHMEG_0006488 [Phytophthora megakarya]|uniref:Uncharacterized protein n=1 Tax=Phytophthora megakarya TaxID=4795 RepID=A0A225WPM9_9STRA|nr:hypothetical protein PHMEG_0006488 [Phytophthora megakarya]